MALKDEEPATTAHLISAARLGNPKAEAVLRTGECAVLEQSVTGAYSEALLRTGECAVLEQSVTGAYSEAVLRTGECAVLEQSMTGAYGEAAYGAYGEAVLRTRECAVLEQSVTGAYSDSDICLQRRLFYFISVNPSPAWVKPLWGWVFRRHNHKLNNPPPPVWNHTLQIQRVRV